jgi:hypothetical protein
MKSFQLILILFIIVTTMVCNLNKLHIMVLFIIIIAT